jgi:hypothetical protein
VAKLRIIFIFEIKKTKVQKNRHCPEIGVVPIVALVGNGEFELCKFLCGFGS